MVNRNTMLTKIYGLIYLSVIFHIVSSHPVSDNDSGPSPAWHCSHICETCNGEPQYNVATETCHCVLRPAETEEDKLCRETMKMNAKVLEIPLELEGLNSRLKRSDETTNQQEIQTESAVDQSSSFVVKSSQTLENTNVQQTDETVQEQNTNIDQQQQIVGAANQVNINKQNNENILAIDSNVGSKKSRHNIRTNRLRSGIRSRLGAAAPAQTTPIPELLGQAQMQIKQIVDAHQTGQLPVENTQKSVKEIQNTLQQVLQQMPPELEAPRRQLHARGRHPLPHHPVHHVPHHQIEHHPHPEHHIPHHHIPQHHIPQHHIPQHHVPQHIPHHHHHDHIIAQSNNQTDQIIVQPGELTPPESQQTVGSKRVLPKKTFGSKSIEKSKLSGGKFKSKSLLAGRKATRIEVMNEEDHKESKANIAQVEEEIKVSQPESIAQTENRNVESPTVVVPQINNEQTNIKMESNVNEQNPTIIQTSDS